MTGALLRPLLGLVTGLALTVALLPGPVSAAPVGPHWLGTSCGAGVREDQAVALAAGRPVKVILEDWACDDPATLRRAVEAGAGPVVLRTGDGMDGVDWARIRRLVEEPRGSGDSYAAVIRDHPATAFWLEIGNEPNYAFDDPWVARWWTIAAIRELADNAAGHLSAPWRVTYPNLRYAASMPVAGAAGWTTADWTRIMLQWLPGQDLGSGGVLDWADGIALHLYGPDGDLRPPAQTHTVVERIALDSPWLKRVLYTEVGVWEGDTCRQEAVIAAGPWPEQTVAVIRFIAWEGAPWPQYAFDHWCGQGG